MAHLANFIAGLREALFSPWDVRGYRIDRHGFQSDLTNLRGDFARVGSDMRVVLKRDKQANQGA